MYDRLPFPSFRATTTESKVSEIVDYLIQLKEALEFVLSDISADNLSPDLRKRLTALGMNIENSNVSREDELSQIAARAITIDDVLSSPAFAAAVEEVFNQL